MVKLFFLGRPYIEVHGQEVHLSRRKNLALLAYLALKAEPCRREELMALLWPELDTYHAQTALRRDLWVLRSTLAASQLVATTETVTLMGLESSTSVATAIPNSKGQRTNTSAVWCDVLAFRTFSAEQQLAGYQASEQQASDKKIERLTAAIQLYRDDFLCGFSLRDSAPFDEWQRNQSEALRHDLMGMLEQLIEAYREQGDAELAITYTQRLIEVDPLYEQAHYQLMELYAEVGRYGAALQQYERWTTLLADNLGVPPSAETTRLRTAIHQALQQRSAATQAKQNDPGRMGDPIVTTPMPSQKESNVVTTLPTPPTPFVGRANEMRQARDLLTTPTCRLLTLLGPGGIGKTRLAIAIADRLRQRYTDGVHFVPLAPLRHHEFLAAAFLEALAIRREPDRRPEETLLAHLQDRDTLLVVDNFEHLHDGGALLSRLLAGATKLQLLVTSRERLNLPEEWLLPLAGLSYPSHAQVVTNGGNPDRPSTTKPPSTAPSDPETDAVQLFQQCARRVQPNLPFTEVDRDAVVTICQLVAGSPLAIELAAGWLPVLSYQAIRDALQQGLDILASIEEEGSNRHRSMRATVAYSWQLATTTEQLTLRQLAVFQGGFLPALAQAVANAAPAMLRVLTDKSWLHRTTTGRIELHELIRQFCVEKLADGALDRSRVYHRHAQAYATFLQVREVALIDQRQLTAVQEIAAEWANIRTAWNYAVDTQALSLLHDLIHSIYRVGLIRNWHWEVIDLFTSALTTGNDAGNNGGKAQTASHRLLQARLHTRLASTLADLGRFDQAIAHCRQSIALLEAQGSTTPTPAWQWESAFVHAIQGYLRNKFGEANSVLDDVQQVYTLLATGAQQPEPDEALVFATVAEAEARFGAGEQESTLARLFALAENLHLAGELWLRVRVLALLAFYLRVKNRLTLCEVYIRERMALCELLGDQRGVAYCLADLGYNALFCDHPDPTTAQRYFTEMAVISDRLRHPIVRSDLLLGLAQIAYFRRAWGEARRYLTESMAIMRTGDNWLDVRVGKLWMGEVALEEGEHSEAQRSF
ncbi:MAG: NACHT domain-containing protein, partial [Caldilineaceae bacterium]|nr:NACHT domain-containing protein [Caldilineaceae bacterium]